MPAWARPHRPPPLPNVATAPDPGTPIRRQQQTGRGKQSAPVSAPSVVGCGANPSTLLRNVRPTRPAQVNMSCRDKIQQQERW